MKPRNLRWLVSIAAVALAVMRSSSGQESVELAIDRPDGDVIYRIVVEKKWGFINDRGEVVIEPQFDWAREFSDGMCQVNKRGKWGYIDESGAWMFDAPLTHDDRPFRCGVAVIYTATGKGIVDRRGQVIECPFDWICEFNEGLAAVYVRPKTKENKPLAFGPTLEQWGFINTKGELVIPTKYTSARAFSHGLAPVYVGGVNDSCTGLHGGKWGFIDKSGKLVIEPQYATAASFAEGLATVSLDGTSFGWIDANGKFVIQPRLLSIATSFQEGVARIRGTPEGDPGWKEFGYINKDGDVFIQRSFDATTSPFSSGLAEARAQPAWDGGKWIQGNYGYVDKLGRWVIEPQFSHSRPFRGKLACVQKDGTMMYIDRTGRIIWPRED
jgi:hypothetical protein